MADLSITVAVTTGTQYVTGSTSNIFTFDGSQPASFTFPWVASGTVRLEQSGSSNDGHPLIFSTSNSTTLGTMQAGIISSGVTYYLDGASNQSDYTNTTTFNAATTRYIEIAPASQTDFYFACWVHGIGMGGIMDMTQDTWGAMEWGHNDWGEQDTFTISPSGFAITAALDDVLSFPEQGWGGDAWGDEDWGGAGTTIFPTGFSITATLDELAYAAATDGWGRSSWGKESWGTDSLTIQLTGLSMTGSLGTLPYAQSESGWGRDEWGIGNWGENTTTVILDGLEITGGLGPDGWGQAPWDEVISWGGDLRLETTQLSEVALTGLEITGSLGTATISRLDMIFDLSTSFEMSAGLGVPNINNGADHSQGVGSLLATMSLGTPTLELGVPLTGIEMTGSLGSPEITSAKLIVLTATNLVTGSVGSITLDDMTVGLTGLSITGSLGSLTITDMQVGISGLEITGALGSAGMSPLHYKDVDITGYTAYTDIEHTA